METPIPRQRIKDSEDYNNHLRDYDSEDLARSLFYEADYDLTKRHENTLLAEYILSQD